jgi:hypothetical protein
VLGVVVYGVFYMRLGLVVLDVEAARAGYLWGRMLVVGYLG